MIELVDKALIIARKHWIHGHPKDQWRWMEEIDFLLDLRNFLSKTLDITP